MTGKALVVAEKVHADLGASNAHRWMVCPGSIRLSEGLLNTSSIHAELGTTAHALAEICLRKGMDPVDYIGVTIEGHEVDEEMAESVDVFVRHCRGLMHSSASGEAMFWIEQRFTLAQLNPPAPMFGTADFVAYDEATRTLYVVDYKNGQGVVVDADDNPQLKYYALGAALAHPELDIDTVSMTIVQPRASHPGGLVRTSVMTYLALVEFAAELLDAARATQEPDAPLVTGDHCRFCPASAICPALRERAQQIAQVEFDVMPLDVPPSPETLPPELYAEMLGKLHILEDWINAMRSYGHRMLEAGEEVPGFKLVAKRATRRWTDEKEMRQWLWSQGYTSDEIDNLKLKSPAQIEKLIGKKNLPTEYVSAVSSGYNMVPDSHPSPAVSLAAADDFDALPSGEA